MHHWLITGGNGFIGRTLRETLKSQPQPPLLTVPDRSCLDLSSAESIANVMAQSQPDVLIHLGGLTPPCPSQKLYEVNTTGTALILEALRQLNKPVRVVLVGSAAELGPVPDHQLPIDETYPCQPATSYGLSKYLATMAGLAMRPPLEVMVARLFNPIGPHAPNRLAFGRFARWLADPNNGNNLVVGDLDAKRDFLDVRDVTKALVALASHGQPQTLYHVGSGESLRVGDGLDELIKLSGRDINIQIDSNRIDPTAPKDSRANALRLKQHCDWSPQIPWRQSLRDLWESLAKSS